MNLVEALESGRQDFLDAVGGLSQAAAVVKPAADRWSVLECVEHVVIVEERFIGWLETGEGNNPTAPNPDKEAQLFSRLTDRTTKVTAPEVVVPNGRFASLEDAVAAFRTMRDRSVSIVKARGESLYSVGAKHPRLGELNGIEVVNLIAGHARRHAAQIREIRTISST